MAANVLNSPQAVQQGYSFVGVFNRRLDEKFVGALRQWDAAWKARHAAPK